MPVMEWDDTLVLDRGVMDDTHREFIGLLNRLADAPDDQMLAALDEFIAHTEAHFSQEERWMEQMSFPPAECHVREHDGVLETAREVRSRAFAGETGFGRVLARAVAQWFANHAASMDNVLALYMKEKGFEPDTHLSPGLHPSRGYSKESPQGAGEGGLNSNGRPFGRPFYLWHPLHAVERAGGEAIYAASASSMFAAASASSVTATACTTAAIRTAA